MSAQSFPSVRISFVNYSAPPCRHQSNTLALFTLTGACSSCCQSYLRLNNETSHPVPTQVSLTYYVSLPSDIIALFMLIFAVAHSYFAFYLAHPFYHNERRQTELPATERSSRVPNVVALCILEGTYMRR